MSSITQGQRFGEVVVLRQGPPNRFGRRDQAWCRCDCGQEKLVFISRLRPTRKPRCTCYYYGPGTDAERFHHYYHAGEPEACWEWTGFRDEDGYGRFTPSYRGSIAAPRMAWILQHGEVDADLVVCHRCDNPPCVNPSHLFVDTRAGNRADCVAKQRQVRGVNQHSHRLTEEQVKQIRSRHIPYKVSYAMLSREYAVSIRCIRRIVQRETWGWLPDEEER